MATGRTDTKTRIGYRYRYQAWVLHSYAESNSNFYKLFFQLQQSSPIKKKRRSGRHAGVHFTSAAINENGEGPLRSSTALIGYLFFFFFFFALQPVSSPCRWCRTHRSSRRCRRGWTAWTGRRQGTLRGERVLLIVLRIITFWEVVNIRWVFHGRHGPTKPEVEPVGVLMQAFERRHFIIGKHRRRPELLLLLLGLWLSLPKTFATVSHCEWTSDHQ